MKPEIEAKFLNVDHDAIRAKLKKLNATREYPMRLMRRTVFDIPGAKVKNSYLRVRDEGHRVTLTYKQFDEFSLTGAKEVETTVGNFEAAVGIAQAIGLDLTGNYESKRELWKLNEVEIMLDIWPWLNPFIEIEAPTEAGVKEVAAKLDLSWSDAVFGDLDRAYHVEYPHMGESVAIYHLPIIQFSDPMPEMLKTPA